MKILIIEDNFELATIYRKILEESYLNSDIAITGKEALKKIKKFKYDIILLDLNLPDIYGLDLFKEIRALVRTVPIIVITARNEQDLVVKALNLGVDDYLKKPIDYDELIARVNAVYRRNNNRENNKISLKNIEVDLSNYLVMVDDKEVNLTKKEFEILVKLIEVYPGVIGRNVLMQSVYDEYQDNDSSVLRVHIYNLKRKFKKLGYVNFIKNEKNKGYYLCLEQ